MSLRTAVNAFAANHRDRCETATAGERADTLAKQSRLQFQTSLLRNQKKFYIGGRKRVHRYSRISHFLRYSK